MNASFSFYRLGLLLKRYFIENKNRELIYWTIFTFLFMFIHEEKMIRVFVIFSGVAFVENQFKFFERTTNGINFLLIPTTLGEKLISSILLSTIYSYVMITLSYILGCFIGTYLVDLAGLGFAHVEAHSNHLVSDILYNITSLNLFKYFIITQSIFLFGSLFFKRYIEIKTLLTCIAIFFLIALFQGLMYKLGFGTLHLPGQTIIMHNSTVISNSTQESTPVHYLFLVFNIATFLLAPFLWVVSYFKLTEKQV